MKTIMLIPLITGTGVVHFISSFAMIEKDKMAIIDFDCHSILKETLLGNVVTHKSSEIKDTLEFISTRFNNLLISFPNKNLSINHFKRKLFLDALKNYSMTRNAEFLIINYPYLCKDDLLIKMMEHSDYVVFLGDYSFEANSALKEILNASSECQFGMILSRPEKSKNSIEKVMDEIEINKMKFIVEIPYSLKFQLAAIQKKVLLELDDNYLSETIMRCWEKVKQKAQSINVNTN